MNFGRLITAMFTPFTANHEIDWAQVESCIERLIATGSDAIVVGGTTAESPTLSFTEKLSLFRFAVEKVKGKVKVIAGAGSNHTQDTIKLTKEAEELGVDGVMLVVPYYNKPSQSGLLQHFKMVAESTSLPIMVYNIPGRTGTNMSVETMVRLAREVRNIVSFKEASGDLGQVSDLVSKVPSNVTVYSGDDNLTLPILSVGGAGVVSVASHIVGNEIKDMMEAFYSGNIKKALSLHQQLLPVFDGLFITSNPVPLKYVMAQKGWCTPAVRPPLAEMNEEEKRETDKWVNQLELKC